MNIYRVNYGLKNCQRWLFFHLFKFPIQLNQSEQDWKILSALSIDCFCQQGPLPVPVTPFGTRPEVSLCSRPRLSLPSKGSSRSSGSVQTQDCYSQSCSCESWIFYGNFTVRWGRVCQLQKNLIVFFLFLQLLKILLVIIPLFVFCAFFCGYLKSVFDKTFCHTYHSKMAFLPYEQVYMPSQSTFVIIYLTTLHASTLTCFLLITIQFFNLFNNIRTVQWAPAF